MRKTFSYSKRDVLARCPLQYFYEYYATDKKVPFDEDRRKTLRALKEHTGCSLLAGDRVHWVIRQFLTKREPNYRRWLESKALEHFDSAVRFARKPEHRPSLESEPYPPPILLEFHNGIPGAEEIAKAARERLVIGIRHFFESEQIVSVWRSITSGEHWVEKRLSQIPKVDGWGIEGTIDLIGRSRSGVEIIDWKLGVPTASHDSLQLHVYALWAKQHLGLEPEQVRVRRVFLGNGVFESPVVLDGSAMKVGKARLIQDIGLMQELEPYGIAGDEEAFTPCGRRGVCQTCKFQRFCPGSYLLNGLRPTCDWSSRVPASA
jgi:hypothetical protein